MIDDFLGVVMCLFMKEGILGIEKLEGELDELKGEGISRHSGVPRVQHGMPKARTIPRHTDIDMVESISML